MGTPQSKCTECITDYAGGDSIGNLRKTLPDSGNSIATPIFSPVSGVVRELSEDGRSIGIYIAPEDSHLIFSPVSGVVTRTEITEGEWQAPLWHISDPKKYGRFRFTFDGDLEMWIEVGHAKYITDTVALYAIEGDSVRAQQQMGEILIGSLAGLRIRGKTEGRFIVAEGERLTGGQSLIGYRGNEW